MLRIRLLFFMTFFVSSVVNTQNKFDYVGGVKLNDSLIITYKVNFEENKGQVKGYSITDIGGEHETRSNIFGEYNKDEKTLSFREIGIVYTKSPISQNDFCFLNTTLKNFVFGKTKKVRANFIGLFSDNTECINGELILSTQEKAEQRVQKVVNKINNSKKITDSVKQKLNEFNLMNVLKMNILKKDQTLSIFSKSSSIKLIVFDGGKLDGDEINIMINGETILNNYRANKSEKIIVLELKNKKTSIVIKANNEGEIAPNTVVVKLDDGTNEIKALSNLQTGETTQIDILRN
ncbi:hypothetical protein SAMN05421824_1476 [Hyunsoonleella jejuensis]|uniref:Uncharacterized protein n=1 Tax=Hyunsoonleella jejuensis TaxID=419940 RepID=A0A1H9FGQ1_9FLAO|nr:hypothetical protein [Hyunsoonleella jejuensis]SEQ37106.1 hypothetical protein SAMN05421824_1476 [Hyunsoonleella jejuensis]